MQRAEVVVMVGAAEAEAAEPGTVMAAAAGMVGTAQVGLVWAPVAARALVAQARGLVAPAMEQAVQVVALVAQVQVQVLAALDMLAKGAVAACMMMAIWAWA